jgi:hypothetical protein
VNTIATRTNHIIEHYLHLKQTLVKIVATLTKQMPHATGLATFLIEMSPTMPIP